MNEIGIQKIVPGVSGEGSGQPSVKDAPGSSFKDLLKDSIRQVDDLQKEAGESAASLAAGETENIHETMIALEKAELSFRLMMQVRNKIVKAYEEIIRMQV
jgi:flagellar hook-basal body complex protein FliE